MLRGPASSSVRLRRSDLRAGHSSAAGLRRNLGAGANRLPPRVPRGVFSLSPAGVACRDIGLDQPECRRSRYPAGLEGLGADRRRLQLELSSTRKWPARRRPAKRSSSASTPNSPKPDWVTNAVAEAGGSFFTFDKDGVPTTIPVFWDPTFLAKKKAMIAALGAHFTGNAAIKIVWTSFANANSEDWSVPHTPAEFLSLAGSSATPRKNYSTPASRSSTPR